jgi:hypothetical protein
MGALRIDFEQSKLQRNEAALTVEISAGLAARF